MRVSFLSPRKFVLIVVSVVTWVLFVSHDIVEFCEFRHQIWINRAGDPRPLQHTQLRLILKIPSILSVS